MSHLNNERFVESSQERFEEAIEAGDYILARGIISQVEEAGFDASTLKEALLDSPVQKFISPSPYIFL